jgi:uncharacterized protein
VYQDFLVSAVDLLIYFVLTLLFSTLFSMGGVGSAIALVSIFPMLGMPLQLAKAVCLFINATSTISASVMNLIRGMLDFRFAMPLVISIVLSTPLGAYVSQFIAEYWVKWLLIGFLLVSATLLIKRRREAKFAYTKSWIMYAIGASVGLVSGLLGVGGGSLIIPLLILLGFEPKKAAYTVSFVIPFSSLGAFFTYLQFVDMDWPLLAVVSLAAFLGGLIGNRIMHFRLTQVQVKQLIAVVLYLLAGKLIFSQF